MAALFSARRRVQTWRQIWVALAESQAELGVGGVTFEQVEELKGALNDIDFDRADELERELRHDVMAHVRAYGEVAPAAAGIVHLGATSAFVVDNGDLLIMREALRVVERKTLCVVKALTEFAEAHADLPTLAWTHFQPAQPTTVGKRACLWIADLMFDLDEIEYRLGGFRLRGIKGTTGTQASFMALTGGDPDKVDALEDSIIKKLGAAAAFPITGQTYSRRVDAAWSATLAGIAQSASKFSYDLRLLQHLGEVFEPFGERQVGSSAMAYKRNPVRAERIGGLARLAIQTGSNFAHTAATQWLERSLDDSANKRIAMPELFLTIDALLVLCHSIANGLEISEAAIARHLADELPAMASENLLMAAVTAGGDRQALHERVRVRAREAAEQAAAGGGNDLLARLASEEGFAELPSAVWDAASDPSTLVGRAPEQARRFVREVVRPRLESYSGELEMTGDVRV
jgi:adenylosuccinate lyase